MCYFQLFQCVKYYLTITAIISLIIVYFIRKRLLSANMSLKDLKKKFLSHQNNEEIEELNNTLELIEYILNNPPSNSEEKNEKDDDFKLTTENEPNLTDFSQQKIDREVKKYEACSSPEPPQNTPIKTAHQFHKCTEGHTPRDIKQKPNYKTPAQPLSLKKPSSLKKTPSRSNAFRHIRSPVASYINHSPIAPLVNIVVPKKPLPGTSSIPEFVKNLPQANPSNKENFNLPSVAYKSAKKTRVIDVPDEQKLPQSHWVKKITTSSPTPLVMRHDHRELDFAKKNLMPQEESFADLSLNQADVSVCTQKSAIKMKKNP